MDWNTDSRLVMTICVDDAGDGNGDAADDGNGDDDDGNEDDGDVN